MEERPDPIPGGGLASAQGGDPGAISRLLRELAQAPAEDRAASWSEALKAGDAVGRYLIRGEIGRGGFGAVYEAFDPELGRTVALKALKPGRTRRQLSEAWIRKEAEAVAKLDHPAIVTVFDVGTCPAGAYLVMELLRGETLAKQIEKGPVPLDEALRIAEQMAEGLAHAHSRGVLHRDLKPANVFVCEDGRVKLLDFGLAHLLGTHGSSGAGTPAYMAPEQAGGDEVDERADVWAAGMVLGEMLTGKRPVERAPTPAAADAEEPKTELMWEAPKVAPQSAPATPEPRLTGVPRPVAKVMGAALSEDPATRPRDGKAWLSVLRSARLLVDRPRRARRIAVLAGVGVIVGLTVAGLATWRVWERQIPGGRPTVAVADFVNETGEKELDSISGLLITSLEQGTQLRVLTRGRMFDVLRQLGKDKVERIDEPLAREVGRETRVQALLLASIRRLGDSYVVDMRALDPLHDEYIFTISDRASGMAAVFDLVDRLGATTRRRLGATEGAAPSRSRKVATITTRNVRAWDFLSRARIAFEQARLGEAEGLVEAALQEDPDFALAHYQYAIMQGYDREWPREGQHAHLEAAERLSDRLPEKERLALLAIRAQASQRWEEARRLRDEAVEAFPLDKEVQYFAGNVRYHTGAKAEAIPFFRQALRLDPAYRPAAMKLAAALLELGRVDEELAWLRDQAPLARSPEELRVLARAFLSAGLEEEAVPLLRRSVEQGGGMWPPPPLLNYLSFTGRAPEAERAAREVLARIPAEPARDRPTVVHSYRYQLAEALGAQGRFRESGQVGDLIDPRPYGNLVRRQWVAAAGQDFPGLRSATQALERLEGFRDVPPQAAMIAAEAGRLDIAGPIARRILEGGTGADPIPAEQAFLNAIWDASEGSGEGVPGRVAAAAEVPEIAWRFPGQLVLGHFLRARGDCAAAIVAYERARGFKWHPLLGDRNAFLPLLLHSLASCYEKLGDLANARARNDEMLRLWARADPDLPLLLEAKAMRARLPAGRQPAP